MKKHIWKVFKRCLGLFDRVFAPACFVCEASSMYQEEYRGYLCQDHKKLLHTHPSQCYVCHKPTHDFAVCYDHMKNGLQGVLVSFLYNPLVSALIAAMKYQGAFTIGDFFAAMMIYDVLNHPQLREKVQENNLIITFVPMSYYKQYYQRGYNQSEKIAQRMSNILGIPCYDLLEKIKETKSQSTLSREERLQNQHVYVARLHPDGNFVKGKNILIIDDVLTTGSTIEACTGVLCETYPGSKVWGLCIARNT